MAEQTEQKLPRQAVELTTALCIAAFNLGKRAQKTKADAISTDAGMVSFEDHIRRAVEARAEPLSPDQRGKDD